MTLRSWPGAGAPLLTRYLQEEATGLEKWCNKWKIDLNADKTQAIVFKRRPKMRIEGNVRLRNMAIGGWRRRILGSRLDRKPERPEQNCTPWQAGLRNKVTLSAAGVGILQAVENLETWTSSEIWSSPPQQKGSSRAQWSYSKKRKAAKISYCEKPVKYDPELEAPHKRPLYQLLEFFFLFQVDDNSVPTSQEEDHNFPQTFLLSGENLDRTFPQLYRC